MGYADGEARTLTQSILEFAAGMGLTDVQAERIIVNLRQMGTAGKVTGREMSDLARGAMVPLDDILNRMAKDMGISKEELNKLIKTGEGIDPKLFVKAFEEMVAEEPRFVGAMGRLGRTFENATKNYNELIQNLISRHIISPIFAQIGEAIAKITDQFVTFNDQGELIHTEKWTELKDAAERVGKAISDIITELLGLAPSSEEIANGMISSVKAVADWLEKHKDDIVGYFKAGVDFINTNVIPIIKELWDWLAKGKEPKFLKPFLDKIKELEPLVEPIKDLFKAIGDVVVIAGKMAGLTFGDLSDKSFAENVKTIAEGITNFAKTIESHKEIIAAGLFGIGIALLSMIVLVTIASVVVSALALVFNFILAGAIAIVTALIIGLIVGFVAMETALWNVGVAIRNMMAESYKNTADLAAKIIKKINDFAATTVKTILSWKDNMLVAFQGTSDGAGAKMATLKNNTITSFEGLKLAVISKINELKNNFSTSLSAIVTTVTNKATEMKNSMINKFTELKNGVVAKLNEIKASIIAIWTNAVNSVGNVNFWQAGYDAMSSMAQGVENGAGLLYDAIVAAAQAAWDAIYGIFTGGSDSSSNSGSSGGSNRSAPVGAASVTAPASSVYTPANSTTTTTITNNYNLTINTSASVEPIVQDFGMMQSLNP